MGYSVGFVGAAAFAGVLGLVACAVDFCNLLVRCCPARRYCPPASLCCCFKTRHGDVPQSRRRPSWSAPSRQSRTTPSPPPTPIARRETCTGCSALGRSNLLKMESSRCSGGRILCVVRFEQVRNDIVLAYQKLVVANHLRFLKMCIDKRHRVALTTSDLHTSRSSASKPNEKCVGRPIQISSGIICGRSIPV